MAVKNVRAHEGGTVKDLNAVAKIKTYVAEGGFCYWVPEDGVRLTTLSVNKDGTYRASDSGYYGYSEVVVSGVGTTVLADLITKEIEIKENGTFTYVATEEDGHHGYSKVIIHVSVGGGGGSEGTTTIDPETGEYVDTRPDPNTGETVTTVLPFAIHVDTPPNKTTYLFGEEIDYTGIEVYAYLKSGEKWTSEDYPNGRIPFEELTLPTTEAGGYSGTGDATDNGGNTGSDGSGSSKNTSGIAGMVEEWVYDEDYLEAQRYRQYVPELFNNPPTTVATAIINTLTGRISSESNSIAYYWVGRGDWAGGHGVSPDELSEALGSYANTLHPFTIGYYMTNQTAENEASNHIPHLICSIYIFNTIDNEDRILLSVNKKYPCIVINIFSTYETYTDETSGSYRIKIGSRIESVENSEMFILPSSTDQDNHYKYTAINNTRNLTFSSPVRSSPFSEGMLIRLSTNQDNISKYYFYTTSGASPSAICIFQGSTQNSYIILVAGTSAGQCEAKTEFEDTNSILSCNMSSSVEFDGKTAYYYVGSITGSNVTWGIPVSPTQESPSNLIYSTIAWHMVYTPNDVSPGSDLINENESDSGDGGSGVVNPTEPVTEVQQNLRVEWKGPLNTQQLVTAFPITVTTHVEEGWEQQ